MNLDFATEVIEASRDTPVLVKFQADWCGPCQMLSPVIHGIVDQFAGRLRLVEIDTDREPAIAQGQGVQGIPDVRLYIGGRQVDRFTGFRDAGAVRAWLSPHLPSPADGDVRAAEAALAARDHEGARAAAERALRADPGQARARAALARALLGLGLRPQARAAAEKIGDAPERARLLPLLAMAEELAGLGGEAAAEEAGKPGDYARALFAATSGDNVKALELLLALVRRDRAWEGGKARLRLLELFAVLGERSELSTTYRKQLASALY